MTEKKQVQLSTFWFISDDLNHDTVFVYALQEILTRYIQLHFPPGL